MMAGNGAPNGRPPRKVILICAVALAASSVVALAQGQLTAPYTEPRLLQEVHSGA